jgi:hypothetical protein
VTDLIQQAEFAKSDDAPVTQVGDSRRALPSVTTKGPLRDATNRPKKTGSHEKSQSFEPPSHNVPTPVIKHKPAPGSLAAARRAATASKATKASESGSQAEKPRHEDDKSSADEPVTRRKAPVTKRDIRQAFDETIDKPKKRQSTDSVELASQMTTEKTSNAAAPIVKEVHSAEKQAAVTTESSCTASSTDAPSTQPSKAKQEDLSVPEEPIAKTSVRLDEYLARKKAKKAEATPDFQHSTSNTNPKTEGSEETQATVQEGGNDPSAPTKEETPLETDIVVASTIWASDKDVTKDETKESNQKSTSSGPAFPAERPATRTLAGRKGARKPGEAGVAVVVVKRNKKAKKDSSPLEAEEESFIVDHDDDDDNDNNESPEVDIDDDARKALENQGLTADAILPGKRRASGGGSKTQTDLARNPVASEKKKQKRKRAEDTNEAGPNNKKARKIAAPRVSIRTFCSFGNQKLTGTTDAPCRPSCRCR